MACDDHERLPADFRRRRPANPFATRYTRPGALPPLDAEGRPLDIRPLVATISRRGGLGIEGPHGTGKSTILAAIVEELTVARRLAGSWRLRRRRDAWMVLRALTEAGPGTVVCLDGWEQLGAAAGPARVLALARGVALVVTSHRPTRLPLVVRTASSARLLARIVAQLPDHGGIIRPDDLADALVRQDGNVREALLDLYDRFERRVHRHRS